MTFHTSLSGNIYILDSLINDLNIFFVDKTDFNICIFKENNFTENIEDFLCVQFMQSYFSFGHGFYLKKKIKIYAIRLSSGFIKVDLYHDLSLYNE